MHFRRHVTTGEVLTLAEAAMVSPLFEIHDVSAERHSQTSDSGIERGAILQG